MLSGERMTKQRNHFARFAAWAQQVIAHPLHFSGFLVVVALWLLWSTLRQFDTFSALLMNDYSTIAEYFFEILVLAAALSAERNADDCLTEIRSQGEEIEANVSEVLRRQAEELVDLRLLVERLVEHAGVDSK